MNAKLYVRTGPTPYADLVREATAEDIATAESDPEDDRYLIVRLDGRPFWLVPPPAPRAPIPGWDSPQDLSALPDDYARYGALRREARAARIRASGPYRGAGR